MLVKMADESGLIQSIADALNSNVFPAIGALLAENAAQAAKIAELEATIAGGEAVEAAESEAAANARAATDAVVALFAPAELPEVDPLPDTPEAGQLPA
jgi:hypothetical protein